MCLTQMPKYRIRTEPTLSIVEQEIRVPYWYKQHEIENERSKKFPDITTRNAMMYYNLQQDALTKQEMKDVKKESDKLAAIATQINGDFYRPKPVVFDAKGNFHRTRVDEQSWL